MLGIRFLALKTVFNPHSWGEYGIIALNMGVEIQPKPVRALKPDFFTFFCHCFFRRNTTKARKGIKTNPLDYLVFSTFPFVEIQPKPVRALKLSSSGVGPCKIRRVEIQPKPVRALKLLGTQSTHPLRPVEIQPKPVRALKRLLKSDR